MSEDHLDRFVARLDRAEEMYREKYWRIIERFEGAKRRMHSYNKTAGKLPGTVGKPSNEEIGDKGDSK